MQFVWTGPKNGTGVLSAVVGQAYKYKYTYTGTVLTRLQEFVAIAVITLALVLDELQNTCKKVEQKNA